MTIHVINCFTCNARIPRTLKTGMVCLLVETGQGFVLVDTGLGLQDYANPTWFTQLFRIISKMSFDSNEAAINRVKQLGFNPEDVKHIILTHMHFDHISGLSDFPHATIHVHKREIDAFTDGKILHWDEFAFIRRDRNVTAGLDLQSQTQNGYFLKKRQDWKPPRGFFRRQGYGRNQSCDPTGGCPFGASHQLS